MKCLVCGKVYEDNDCPRCKFPNIQIPLDGMEEKRKALQPTIDAYRKKFLPKIEVGVVIYHWKDDNGTLAVEREERRSFGTGDALYGKMVWLDQKFARVPEEKTLPIRTYIRMNGEEREEMLQLPNLQEAQLQEIGISMDEAFDLSLHLRNGEGTPVCSEKTPLFE